MTTTEYRAHFDVDIRFANGGELSGTGFRLDLPSNTTSTDDIALLLMKHLGLALAGEESRTRGRSGSSMPAHAWSASTR